MRVKQLTNTTLNRPIKRKEGQDLRQSQKQEHQFSISKKHLLVTILKRNLW